MSRARPCSITLLWTYAVVIALCVDSSSQQSGAATVPAQLSLPAATEIMLTGNPLLLRERQNLPVANSAVVQARQPPNPAIEVASESYPLFSSNPGSFLNNQELTFRADQTLETAGKRKKRVRVAQQDVAIAGADIENTVRLLKLELKRRYYTVVLAKAQAELAREMLDQFDQIIRLNEARYKEGELSGLEINRTRIERLRFFNDLVDATLQVKNAKTALLEVMGIRDLTTDFDVEETPTLTPKPLGIEILQDEVIQGRPDLAAAQYAAERNSRQLDLERANAIPNVTPNFGYKRNFGVNTMVAGVSVPLPLFNRNQGGISRATAQIEQQNYEVSRVSLAVRREVQEAFQSVNAQAEKVKALEEQYVPSARRAREIAQESYRLGALDLIGLLDSERAYRETLRAYNQALYDYRAARFQLEAAMGKEL